MEKNLEIDEIIDMGGYVELTNPLMVFVAEKGAESNGENTYPPGTRFAIVLLAEKSHLQILATKDNGIYGIVTEPVSPRGAMAEEVNYEKSPTEFRDLDVIDVPIDMIKGNNFISSRIELAQAILPKRKKTE